MIRVERDRVELLGDPCVRVHVEHRNASSEPQATVCGYCAYPDRGLGDRVSKKLPVEEAFRQACRVAKEKGFSAIWIDDRDLRFDFEPWKKMWLE
jgi:hypothetical protein